jgi:hypothetical protein
MKRELTLSSSSVFETWLDGEDHEVIDHEADDEVPVVQEGEYEVPDNRGADKQAAEDQKCAVTGAEPLMIG